MDSSRFWSRGGERPDRSGGPPAGRAGGPPPTTPLLTPTAVMAASGFSPATATASSSSSSLVSRLSSVSPALLALGAGALLAGGYFAYQNRRRLLRLRDSVLGRPSLEERLLRHVFAQAREGDPDSVIAAIDEFCNAGHWMMHVGDVKGSILDAEVRKARPAVVLELGTYCGYSAMHIARLLPEGGHVYSVDVNPLHAAIAARIIDFAGLSDRVTIVVGTLGERLHTLRSRLGVSRVDLVFLDHLKSAYKSDLQLLEQSGLIQPGSVLVADNCRIPGAPEYVAYIREHPQYDSVCHETKLEYSQNDVDHVWVSVRK